MSLRHPVPLCSFQISMFLSKWLLWTVRDTMLVPPFRVGGVGAGCGLSSPSLFICVCVCARKREKECVCVCVSWGVLSLTVCQCVSVREQNRESVCVFEFRACASSD